MSGVPRFSNSIDVQICSVNRDWDRIESDDGIPRGFPIASWRNNLTALSQRHNLLFVASKHEILAVAPDYPYQTVIWVPVIKLKPPNAAGRRRGYIDPSNPHAISHLIIGDLGDEEVLLVSCDDGDVIAYFTHTIWNTTQLNDLDLAYDPKPFFLENVGSSAWGLAIHKEARLIAVSANTHEVTVFAFALGFASSSSESDSEAEDETSFLDDLGDFIKWNPIEMPYNPEQRSRNLIVHLVGHNTNIPNIAFCNGPDPCGQFLISTDIEGNTFVWHVWEQRKIQDCSVPVGDRLGRMGSNENISPRGWGVACIDPKSARTTDYLHATFGCEGLGPRDSHSGRIWDNSLSIENVPNSSAFHPAMAEFGAVPGIRQGVLFNDDGDDDDDDDSDSSFPIDWPDEDAMEQEIVARPFEVRAPDEAVILAVGDTSNSSDDQTSATGDEKKLVDEGAAIQEYNAQAEPPHTSLPFRLLCTNEFDITLFDEKTRDRVTCEDALHQTIPPRLYGLISFDRLNMIHQIPSLGLVIVASQAGRAALLTITEMKPQSKKSSPLKGFRVEHILPFKSQEEQGRQRPEVPLLGIAVGPVQGHLGTGDNTDAIDKAGIRYRLLMIYYDHSVLSYEIGRGRCGSGFEVDDRILVI